MSETPSASEHDEKTTGMNGISSSLPDALLEVVVLTCNNESTIRQTLESVQSIAQKIIVVDSGSTDSTVSICEEFNAQIISRQWEGHVKQKQFALEQCQTEWVFCIDSDESMDKTMRQQVVDAVTQNDAAVAGYAINRKIFFLGKWLHSTFQPEWRLRLVRREYAHWTGYDPHDKLIVEGETKRLAGTLRHDSWANIEALVKSQVAHGLRSAESYHEMGKRASVSRLLWSPPAAVLKQLVLRRAYKDGWRGAACAMAVGIGVAAKYLRLLELGRTEKQQ